MVSVTINGVPHTFDGDPEMPVLWYLRDVLRMTGTKFGCGAALCGACTVHVDGAAVRSCTTPVSAVAGKKVTTIEGLDPKGMHPVQVAWRANGVPQCGYCQSGQIMQAAALLKQNGTPTDAQIESAMAGNICRCGTYTRVKAAIKQASAAMRKGA
jgi:isoquinoline 1-oxidoreductase subunit alpha